MAEWRGVGTLDLTRADGSSFVHVGCPSTWIVVSQDGGEFSGSVTIIGSGRSSDPYCSYSGSFKGTVTADGAVTIRVDPRFTSTCTQVAGDGTFTGTTRPDGTVFLETSAAARCGERIDQQQDVTRSITFTWTRK